MVTLVADEQCGFPFKQKNVRRYLYRVTWIMNELTKKEKQKKE